MVGIDSFIKKRIWPNSTSYLVIIAGKIRRINIILEKLMRLLTTLFLIPVLSFFTQAAAASSDWELEKVEEDYQLEIYTREIGNSDLKEFKGEMIVDEKLSSLVALLVDDEAAPEWMNQCEKFEILERSENHHQVIYFVNGAPWPVSDRDAVISSDLKQDPKTLAVRIDLKALTGYLPKDDDFVRIPRMVGFWEFIPQTSGKVLVRYQIHAEPGGSLPAWLANSVVVDTPYNTMTNMLDMLKREKYKTAEFSFIKNVQ